jgi:hypothetical protein
VALETVWAPAGTTVVVVSVTGETDMLTETQLLQDLHEDAGDLDRLRLYGAARTSRRRGRRRSAEPSPGSHSGVPTSRTSDPLQRSPEENLVGQLQAVHRTGANLPLVAHL